MLSKDKISVVVACASGLWLSPIFQGFLEVDQVLESSPEDQLCSVEYPGHGAR